MKQRVLFYVQNNRICSHLVILSPQGALSCLGGKPGSNHHWSYVEKPLQQVCIFVKFAIFCFNIWVIQIVILLLLQGRGRPQCETAEPQTLCLHKLHTPRTLWRGHPTLSCEHIFSSYWRSWMNILCLEIILSSLFFPCWFTCFCARFHFLCFSRF